MSHRSRLSTILIDVPAEQTASAVSFWSQALGVDTRQPPGEPQFTGLIGALPGLTLAIQSIDGDARYHVDFETDDVEAETARLVALGAEQIDQWLECRILRIPGGQLACVIPRHSDDETFARLSTLWQ
ncbi:VOC family protein [Paractinoplanes lichenicola]|uniref:Glyoxalase/bleomycin resistance/dioxygenase family protein n=1 Tax=Paractinoplanes lichenicola TaxID=2802976 RepID=A0ABS1VVA1_9ACTN|nr:VOC family protein [Actinoplanes lichenicola]MBL7258372.1 glyoxalase/bleomycin resistance/dioxygenase family protein [Actinoplanes lichenicola]